MRTLINVDPSPEQLKILSDAGPGLRLIRGAAGSGKTTAALLRLRQLCGSRLARRTRLRFEHPVRVLVLTFNSTLRGYISELVRQQIQSSDALHLTMDTFGGWALSIIGQQKILGGKELRSRIRVLLQREKFAITDVEYFVDEVEYAVGRFPPNRRNEYIDALRSGRGRAPAVPRPIRQKILAEIIEPFERQKAKNGESDWNDIALKATASHGKGYDVVVVDEAQDLSANQVRAILAHSNEDSTLTFILDSVQRIYPQRFQWRQDLGIEIRPQMVFTLARNHRNTKEIARFAMSLVRDIPVEEDGLLPDENACERTGSIPCMVEGSYDGQFKFMLKKIELALKSNESVAILKPRGGGWFNRAKETLEKHGITFCELTRQRQWPTGPELVALSTIHSAKGLEFDHVFLPGLSQKVTPHGEEDGDGSLESLRRLVAMGIGRARKSAMVGFKPGEESTLIAMFDPNTYRLIRV